MLSRLYIDLRGRSLGVAGWESATRCSGAKKLQGPGGERPPVRDLHGADHAWRPSFLGLKTAGSAAVVFKPQSSGEFVRSENEIQELLDVTSAESGVEDREAQVRLVRLRVADRA